MKVELLRIAESLDDLAYTLNTSLLDPEIAQLRALAEEAGDD